MRVLVFGDSITQGYWDTDGGWVERIRKHYDELQLKDLRNNDEPTLFNLGVSADTTEDILKRIRPETVVRTRHGDKPVVIVQIGTNDSSKQEGSIKVDIEQYKQNLVNIIEEVKPISSKLIMIGSSAGDDKLTMPVFWGNYFYPNKQIKTYENAMCEVAAERQIDFIPVFNDFKAALDEGNDLLADGLHPNNDGHQLVADIILPELNKFLKANN